MFHANLLVHHRNVAEPRIAAAGRQVVPWWCLSSFFSFDFPFCFPWRGRKWALNGRQVRKKCNDNTGLDSLKSHGGQIELLSGEAKHEPGADVPMRSASHLLHRAGRDVAFPLYDLSPDPRFCGHTGWLYCTWVFLSSIPVQLDL
jgi:hypothetical protein